MHAVEVVEAQIVRRETGKNTKAHRIANPKTAFYLFRKMKSESEIGHKMQTTVNRKTELFRCKNRKTNPESGRNRKAKNPNAPLIVEFSENSGACTSGIRPSNFNYFIIFPGNLFLFSSYYFIAEESSTISSLNSVNF